MARLPYIESTTQQIFIFNTLTLCTILFTRGNNNAN